MGLFGVIKASNAHLACVAKAQEAENAIALPRADELAVAPVMAQRSSDAWLKAHERLHFMQEVVLISRRDSVPEPVACTLLATRGDAMMRYPLLSKAGKKGSSALTYANFRSWIARTGRKKDKSPNADNISALLDTYYDKAYTRPGNALFWKTFMRCFLSDEQPPVAKAYGEVVRACEALHVLDVPSLAQVRFFLKHKFNLAATALARRGDTWGENRLGGYVHRDWRSIAVGDCWVGDHHKLDCFVKVFDEEKQKLVLKRPWLTAWMDIRSLYFVGFEVGVSDPNSTTIMRALAYGYACNDWHGPNTLYSDNGRDFKKLGFALPLEVGGHQHSILNALGVKALFALPYRGRSKPIERIFKEVAEGFCKTLPTYCGSNPGDRPETVSYYDAHVEDAPSILDVQQGFFRWVMDVYHRKPQTGKIIGAESPGKPMSPAEAWAMRSHFGRTWTPGELSEAFRLPMVRTRKVGQGYCVRIGKADYRASRYGHALDTMWGRDVMIKADFFGGVYAAYLPDGKKLCDLEQVPSVNALYASDDDAQATLLRDEMAWQRRTIKSAKACALDATGLPCLIDADTAIKLLNPAARLVLGDGKASVKGSTHKYIHASAELPGDAHIVPDVPTLEESAETQEPPATLPGADAIEKARKIKALKRLRPDDF